MAGQSEGSPVSETTGLSLKRLTENLLLLNLVGTLAALVGFFILTPASENQLLFGLSRGRLGLVILVAAAAFVFALLLTLVKDSAETLFIKKVEKVFRKKLLVRLILLAAALLFFCSVMFVLLALSNIGTYSSLIPSLISRTGPFVFLMAFISWAVLFWLKKGALSVPVAYAPFSAPVWRAFLFAVVSVIALLAFSYYDQQDWSRGLPHTSFIFLLPALICAIKVIGTLSVRSAATAEKWQLFMTALLLAAITFSIIRLTGYMMYRVTTAPKSYWDLLADAFLQGRMYLINPPSNHDLTLYNGSWFVPNPPLPSLLLLPYVALFGLQAVNMTVFSAMLAAINTMLVFLTLEKAASIGMISSGRKANLWVTIVFAFATDHFWLATTGQMWFVSQLCAFLFCALACLVMLAEKPAWLSGMMLGLAMLARPNIFPLAIFLLGIVLWRHSPKSPAGRRLPCLILKKGIALTVPMGLSGLALLWYNHVRFDNWLDFGYVAINGAPWILESVQRYGMFHPHFVPINLNVMFLRLPQLDLSGARFFYQPGITGTSIFLMTPPLLMLFKPVKSVLWRWSAWLSIAFTTLLLLLYHNTGAEQVGYRYLLDMLMPILLLLADNVGKKPGLFFRILTILGILINWISIYWWYLGRV